MPLNINQDQEQQNSDVSPPQPILYTPAEEKPRMSKIVLAICIVAIVGAAICLYYIYSIRSGKSIVMQQQEPVKTQSAEVTGAVSAPSNPIPTIGPKETIGGRYTIFIASYPNHDPAQEEVSRWDDAGYEAFVIQANNHYRVALGAYSGVSGARQTAEQLQDAFENGYWIGTLQ